MDMLMLTVGGLLYAGDFELYPANYLLSIGGTPAPAPDDLNLRFVAHRR